MQKKRILFLLLFFGIFATNTEGAVRLPCVLSDHMVLQRGKPVRVWGWAEAGEKVTVEVAGRSDSATADAEGKWRIVLDPLPAGIAARGT